MNTRNSHFTLTEAMNLAPSDVIEQRARWPQKVFDQAVEHHTGQNIRANITIGMTHDKDGFVSQFTNYDWALTYHANPDRIYNDFFKGSIGNSCSRIMRGLTP